MSQNEKQQREPVECVQFTLRVYADGRRERVAQTMLETEHGLVEIRRPSGEQWDVMRPLFADGLAEVGEAPQRARRRVPIDERVARMRDQRR